jgi:hypothetical protein
LGIVGLRTTPSLEDEEIFDTNHTYRSQYQFETTEDDLNAQYNDLVSHCGDEGELDPESLESSALRGEYLREQTEKAQYRRLYLELQERCHHYQ